MQLNFAALLCIVTYEFRINFKLIQLCKIWFNAKNYNVEQTTKYYKYNKYLRVLNNASDSASQSSTLCALQIHLLTYCRQLYLNSTSNTQLLIFSTLPNENRQEASEESGNCRLLRCVFFNSTWKSTPPFSLKKTKRK